MRSLETVYWRLPVAVQNLACNLEGWRANRIRFGPGSTQVRNEVLRRASLSDADLAAFRDARLRAFLLHAAGVEYYRKSWAETGFNHSEVRSLDDIALLPVIDKATAKTKLTALSADRVPQRDLLWAHTGGSTGAGLRFRVTRQAVQEQWATYWRYWGWHGITPQTLCAFFGGRSVVPVRQTAPPFWRTARSQRRILFSAHHMSPAHLPHYVSELRRSQPPWIHGYPSLLALLASHIVESEVDLGYQVRWITTGAENLLAHQRSLLQRAFGVRPRQHYGSTEAVAQFSECPEGRLHVDEDFAAVEFVEDDSGLSRVVGTNLSNLATPLVRYDVGDLARVADDHCSCGRPGRIVAELDGRSEDYVVTRSGARVAALNHIFKDMIWIREAQIVQRRSGEITICVVPIARVSDSDVRGLMAEARRRFGDDTPVGIELVDSLPRSANGKLRMVVSEAALADAVPRLR